MEYDNFSLLRAIYSDRELDGYEKAVAVCLVWHRNKLTGQCNPSQATLAAETGFSLSTVKRATTGLKSKGWVTCRRTQTSAHWFFNGFSVCQTLPMCPIDTSQKQDRKIGRSPFCDDLESLEQAKQYGQDESNGRAEEQRA